MGTAGRSGSRWRLFRPCEPGLRTKIQPQREVPGDYMKLANSADAGMGQIARTNGCTEFDGVTRCGDDRHQTPRSGGSRARFLRARASVILIAWRKRWARYNAGVRMNVATRTTDARAMAGGFALAPRVY